MKHKIPRVAARFPAFWLILTVYLLEFGVPGPGQCHLILRQLSMWVPAVLGMMLMRLSGSYNMAVGTQMTFSAALLGILLQWYSVPMWAACVVVLAVAVVLGILYTVLSNRMQIPLFYMSLCVHLLLDGLNGFFYRMTRQTSNYAYAGADRTRWLGVPLWCWIALAALALGTAYLNRTTYGRSLFLLPWYHDVRWQEIGESRRIKTGTRLKLDLILGAANVLSCVLVGLSRDPVGSAGRNNGFLLRHELYLPHSDGGFHRRLDERHPPQPSGGGAAGQYEPCADPDAGSPSADHEFVRRVLSERRADPDECGVGGGPKEKTAATQKSYHLIQNLSHCNKIFCVI